MKNFTIPPISRWYTVKNSNDRQLAVFVNSPIAASYHQDYHPGNKALRKQRGTVEYIITTLKNQFHDTPEIVLQGASNDLIEILKQDLPKILIKTGKEKLTVCVIPRAKAENTYSPDQLYFKRSVQRAVAMLNAFEDGSDFIVRHTDTRTTHMDKSGYGGTGNLPYPGITQDTCTIAAEVRNKDILLIDDLYTESVNIDEDAIQTLLNHGANSVTLYCLGRTKSYQSDIVKDKAKLYKQTLKDTYDLIIDGYSIEAISKERGVTVGTIVNHIWEISTILGSYPLEQFRPPESIILAVKEAAMKLGSSRKLKPIFEELNEEIPYNDILLALIFTDEY